MKWTVILAMMMAFGGIGCLATTGDVTTHMVVATIFGISAPCYSDLACWPLHFFSDKSGHDQIVTKAGRKERVPRRITACESYYGC